MGSIWSGAIAFGLVSVPVRMESAVEEHTLQFNYVHEPDGGRLVAVATFVMRERQHLACLCVRERVIQLERMHFADEIRPAKELAPKGVRVAKEELAMAVELVRRFEGAFVGAPHGKTEVSG